MNVADVAAVRYIEAEQRFRELEMTARAENRMADAEGAMWYANWCHRAAVNELDTAREKVTTPAVLCVSGHDMRLCVNGVRCTRCDYRQAKA